MAVTQFQLPPVFKTDPLLAATSCNFVAISTDGRYLHIFKDCQPHAVLRPLSMIRHVSLRMVQGERNGRLVVGMLLQDGHVAVVFVAPSLNSAVERPFSRIDVCSQHYVALLGDAPHSSYFGHEGLFVFPQRAIEYITCCAVPYLNLEGEKEDFMDKDFNAPTPEASLSVATYTGPSLSSIFVCVGSFQNKVDASVKRRRVADGGHRRTTHQAETGLVFKRTDKNQRFTSNDLKRLLLSLLPTNDESINLLASLGPPFADRENFPLETSFTRNIVVGGFSDGSVALAMVETPSMRPSCSILAQSPLVMSCGDPEVSPEVPAFHVGLHVAPLRWIPVLRTAGCANSSGSIACVGLTSCHYNVSKAAFTTNEGSSICLAVLTVEGQITIMLPHPKLRYAHLTGSFFIPRRVRNAVVGDSCIVLCDERGDVHRVSFSLTDLNIKQNSDIEASVTVQCGLRTVNLDEDDGTRLIDINHALYARFELKTLPDSHDVVAVCLNPEDDSLVDVKRNGIVSWISKAFSNDDQEEEGPKSTCKCARTTSLGELLDSTIRLHAEEQKTAISNTQATHLLQCASFLQTIASSPRLLTCRLKVVPWSWTLNGVVLRLSLFLSGSIPSLPGRWMASVLVRDERQEFTCNVPFNNMVKGRTWETPVHVSCPISCASPLARFDTQVRLSSVDLVDMTNALSCDQLCSVILLRRSFDLVDLLSLSPGPLLLPEDQIVPANDTTITFILRICPANFENAKNLASVVETCSGIDRPHWFARTIRRVSIRPSSVDDCNELIVECLREKRPLIRGMLACRLSPCRLERAQIQESERNEILRAQEAFLREISELQLERSICQLWKLLDLYQETRDVCDRNLRI